MTLLTPHFAEEKIDLLLNRYEFSYYREDSCIEYFIADKRTGQQISRALIFSLNQLSQQIIVVRFCPELYKQDRCKYLSAACFYLLTHHFSNLSNIPREYCICLETRLETYNSFFSKLKDFHLLIEGIKLCKTAKVCGRYPQLNIDTSMLTERIERGNGIPFLV